MSDQSKDKITRIIKALLAKAAGTDNEAEADIFLAKAHEMMEQYQVDVTDFEKDDPIAMTVAWSGRSDGPNRYTMRLWKEVSMFYGCRIVYNHIDHKKVNCEIVGRESSRITAELMFPFILDQVNTSVKKIIETHGGERGAVWRDVVNALVLRIARLRREQKVVPPQTVSGKNALATIDAVKAKLDELYPRLTTGIARSLSTSGAARTAAEGISLHRQTTGSTTKRLT